MVSLPSADRVRRFPEIDGLRVTDLYEGSVIMPQCRRDRATVARCPGRIESDEK
jgi:hypothetical protein